MRSNSSETAILFFTRQAAREAAAKSFTLRSRKSNFQVAASLIKQTLTTARQTQIPVFISSGDEFAVTGFGQKLTAAVASVFGQGFKNLLIIGNDCPTLTPALLLKAQAILEARPMVLGPATDGGVYLIGLTRAAFQQNEFCWLPWLTDQVFASLQQYACGLGLLVSFLPVHQDIDTAADLQKIILQFGAGNPVVQKLKSILSSLTKYFPPFICFNYAGKVNLNLPNRAPPLVYFF